MKFLIVNDDFYIPVRAWDESDDKTILIIPKHTTHIKKMLELKGIINVEFRGDIFLCKVSGHGYDSFSLQIIREMDVP